MLTAFEGSAASMKRKKAAIARGLLFAEWMLS
jgi:hypothetical protein